jgi:hypothetical protein
LRASGTPRRRRATTCAGDSTGTGRKTQPRPGAQQPLQFATTARIDAYGTLRDEFLERILHMGSNIFVSDESALDNFPGDVEDYKRRIMLLYNVDADELPDQRLVTILDAIAARRQPGG